MKPKEKAKELVDKMSSQTYSYQPFAGARYIVDEIGSEAGKKCALIAVDEIIKTLYEYHYDSESGAYEYYIEVKTELNNL
jgi:hypothetical protein